MKTSQVGIDLIKKYEGFSSKPYNCPAGHCTIGYGTLLHKGKCIPDDCAKFSNGINEDIALGYLKKELETVESALNKTIKVPLTQNQFDSLASWAYNLGIGNLKESKCTWLRLLNKGMYDKVPEQLLKWNKANGKVLPGLTKRRQEEADLFSK